MTNQDCLRMYGFPYDLRGTSENEQVEFERDWMTFCYLVDHNNVTPSRIYCHKRMVEPLTNAHKNLIRTGAIQELKSWDGCYNPRPIRGYENVFKRYLNDGNLEEAAKYLSKHSWAIAIDVNAAWNRLGMKPTLTPKFVKCFTDAGFSWGGHFKRLDGMHFEL